MRAKFEERFVLYPSHSCLSEFVDIETIDKVVYNMKKGKAAGSDSLTVEHVLYAHPAIYRILCNLFNCMFDMGFVLDSFGAGITFPILKEPSRKSSYDLDGFRGITVSPVISKICLTLCLS